ncbi:hypothetical protein DFJ74DRAFT_421597 [Hyaloraphidium curvatum]|nr:hypothetical protein DFJ74DRAFT_421597 [Hyaloraphidium curvatum]
MRRENVIQMISRGDSMASVASEASLAESSPFPTLPTLTFSAAGPREGGRNFTDREWLALFPDEPSIPYTILLPSATVDRAAELRAAEPLTEAAFRAGLAPYHVAAGALGYSLFIQRLSRLFSVINASINVASILLLVALWVLNDRVENPYPTKQLGFATAAILVLTLGLVVVGVRDKVAEKGLAEMHNTSKEGDFSAHPYAGVARYTQLVEDGPSALTLHDDRDDLCPCPRKSCAGDAPNNAAREALITGTGCLLAETIGNTLVHWTVIVAWAPVTYTSPWAIFFVTLFYFTLMFQEISTPYPTSIAGHPPMDLAKRLRSRAVILVLRDLLHRERDVEDREAVPTNDLSDEPYALLHKELSRTWRVFLARSSHGRTLFATVLAQLIGSAIMYLIGGQCIPVWIPVFFTEFTLVLLRDLALLALWNSSIEQIRKLYASTVVELLSIGTPSARRHADLITAFVGEDVRGKWMGFLVDFSAVRTAAVTLFTIGVGLYTIFRGLGITFQVSTVCSVPA